jgi:DNA-binding transcriptional ArsR family regulator
MAAMAKNGIRTLPPGALALVAARFRTLADPLRLRILQSLEHGEKNVGELTGELRASQPNVSKQLKALRDAGFVDRRTEGTSAYWSVSDPAVFTLCDAVCRGLRERLSSEAKLLGSSAGSPRRR